MKSVLRLIFLVSLFAACVIAAIGAIQPSPSDPGNMVYTAVRQDRAIQVATVDVNDTAAAAGTSSWTDCLSKCTAIPPQWRTVILSFYGYGDGSGVGSPDNATFKYDVYACGLYGGLQLVSNANTGTIGAEQMSHNPATGAALTSTGVVDPNYCWADSLAVGTSKWYSAPTFSGTASDTIGEMSFDRRDKYGVFVRIYDMTDSAVTAVRCVMNGY